MSLTEYTKMAWGNLVHRKKRAYLTVIGIFIGIMAVVALISLGQGLQQGVNAEFSKLGVDKIFIQPATAFGSPGESSPNPLTDKDLTRVRAVNGVKEAIGVNIRSAKVDWADQTIFTLVYASPKDSKARALFNQIITVTADQGRSLESNDLYKAVIGVDLTDKSKFRQPLELGSTLKINNITFTVVGVNARIGNPQDDQLIIISENVYNSVIPTNNHYDMLAAQVQPGLTASVVAERIKQALRNSRSVKAGEEDFSVQTAEDIQQSFNSILAIINTVLTGIAAISLLVGGIGIMNTMYTAVLERTKEIGIMKAVGATNEAILTIFLIESGMLGLVGGAVGVALGLGISYLGSIIAAAALGNNLVQAYVSWWLVLGALAFSFIVGTAAGLLPARQAAGMKPVDSLRYE